MSLIKFHFLVPHHYQKKVAKEEKFGPGLVHWEFLFCLVLKILFIWET